jgi:hypothetical protein
VKGTVRYHGNQHGHRIILTGEIAEWFDRWCEARGVTHEEGLSEILRRLLRGDA